MQTEVFSDGPAAKRTLLIALFLSGKKGLSETGQPFLITILCFHYSIGVVQPYLSSNLPHWIPVNVS